MIIQKIIKEKGTIRKVTNDDIITMKTNPEEFWEGVTEIGNGAFFGCDITEIEIPEGVTKIGVAAFMNCKRITNVTIPSSVTKIGDYAFYGCESIAKINMPANVKEIGEHAFDDHCIQMKM